MDPATIITIVTGVLKVLAGLGWFSRADWPEELDEAQDKLREIPGVDITRLESVREEAHRYYLEHHHALPWDKAHYLELFQGAIRAWGVAIKEEAKEAAKSIGYLIQPWYIKYLPYGLMAGLGVSLAAILLVKSKK